MYRPIRSTGFRLLGVLVLLPVWLFAALDVKASHPTTTVFVDVGDGNCSDGAGAGGASMPFCSIQAAVDHASEGDMVLVAAGTYEERFDITTANLTLLGANAGVHGSSAERGPETRVNGQFPVSGAIRIEADGLVLDGFEFDQINEGIQVGYAVDGVKDLVITNSRIRGAGEFGVSIFAGEGSEITRNHFEDNGSGVDITLGTALLRFNNFVNNQTAGVRAAAALGGPAVSVDARLNWWGHVSGPGVDTAEGLLGPGLGDRVTTFVDFIPYCTTPAPDCEPSFVDSAESVHSTDINMLALAGITRGCNPPVNDRFCPDDFVTRGEMAAFLVRALKLTDDGGGDLFVDDDESIFERDIDRLATAGITRGCNPPVNDRFCPDEFVTRAQMASFLIRSLDWLNE